MTTMIPTIPGHPRCNAERLEGHTFMQAAAEDRAQPGVGSLITPRSRRASRDDAANREHARKLVEAREDAYRFIARELHDDIGQRLSLLSIKLGMLQQLQEISDPGGNLAESLRDLDVLISDVHRLSHSLHSSRIESIGLVHTLKDACERVSGTCNKHIEFVAEDIPGDLPPTIVLCFFRVAQESLNNAVKHSGASRIAVEIGVDDEFLTMRVMDFGSGFDRNRVKKGLGLSTMEERMFAVGGTLSVESVPGAGTLVTAVADLRFKTALASG